MIVNTSGWDTFKDGAIGLFVYEGALSTETVHVGPV
jgi:hypothetical protein